MSLTPITPIAMFPVLVTPDLAQMKAFYENSFGFISEFYQEDFYLHLLQPEAKVQLAFMVPDHPSQPGFLHQPASANGMVISLEVADAKAAYEEAVRAKMNIVFEYTVEEFGTAHFMLKDPAGLVIDIVEHLEQTGA